MSKVFSCLKLYLIIIFFFALGCQQNDISYAIEEETMVKILMDMHVAEAATLQGDISQRDSLRKIYYDQIFEIHEISKKTYEEDMEVLKRDAKKLASIYDKVIEQLKQRKAEINTDSKK